MLILRVEEVLPRPGAGLLHRMLRLAPVDLVTAPITSDPVLVLRPSTQYQIGVRIYPVTYGFTHDCSLHEGRVLLVRLAYS